MQEQFGAAPSETRSAIIKSPHLVPADECLFFACYEPPCMAVGPCMPSHARGIASMRIAASTGSGWSLRSPDGCRAKLCVYPLQNRLEPRAMPEGPSLVQRPKHLISLHLALDDTRPPYTKDRKARVQSAHFFLETPTVLPRRPVVLVCWPRTLRPQ